MMIPAVAPGTARFRLGELAERFALTLIGRPDPIITGVNSLLAATPGEIAFLANPRYRKQLADTAAGAVVIGHQQTRPETGCYLLSDQPYVDFARIASLFEQRPLAVVGIHPSAVIDASAEIAASASIGPLCNIGPRVRIAAGVAIGPGCSIGPDCTIDAHCRLLARVTLVERCRLGQRVLIHPGAVLGAEGFGLAMDHGQWRKVPQLGGVCIGDDCEIGANTCIDRGALGDTTLEADVHLDNLIQVGHNVQIGAHTAIAGCTAIAGSARIGRHCLIGGGAGIIGHIEIADGVVVGAMSLVTHSLREAGEYCSGTPIQPKREWAKNAARFRQLDRIARQLKPKEPKDS